MTDDNQATLVSSAAGKSTREVEHLVASIVPKRVPADCVTESTDSLSSREVTTEVLTETLLRKHMTVDSDYESLLKAARDALSHSHPGASELEILKQGLRLIIKSA